MAARKMTTQRDKLARLEAELWTALSDADVAVKAQVAGQLRATIKDLAALGEETPEVTAADEIAARRKARLTGASGIAPATRRGQSRRRGGSNRAG